MAYRNEKNRKPAYPGCQNSGIWIQPNRYPASGAGRYSYYGDSRYPMSGMMGMPPGATEIPGMWNYSFMSKAPDMTAYPEMGKKTMQYGYVADPYMMQMDMADQEEWEQGEQRDLEYWRQMYPEKIRRIQDYVTEQCDRVDYDDSFIYDEYPDPVAVRNMCSKIQERLKEDKMFQEDWSETEDNGQMQEQQEEDLIEMNQLMNGPGPVRPPRPPQPPRPPHRPNRPGNWLNDIISVLLFDELHRRRCRSGHCRRRY